PEVKLKGKSVIVTLPDSLAEETTYSLNFGNAIADLNEGNVLQNYSFIFSTGSFLDSIQLSGHVMDAVTLKPAEGVWVMLYPTGHDSVVYKQKPEYLAKTSKDGKWSISNIRRDSFLVVALKDENLNFLYDQETELFGWNDHNVKTDSNAVVPDLFVFPREKKKVIIELRHPFPGWIKMAIPGIARGEMPEFIPALPNPIMEWATDSLNIWYDRNLNYAGRAILGQDTTRVRASDSPIPKQKKFKIVAMTGRMHPKDVAKYKIGIPIARIDTSLIELSKDTVRRIPFEISRDSLLPRVMNIKASWVPASRYAIKFFPGAITDIWDNASDSFTFSFVVNGLD
ncbi:MAG TPA: Ig-like domain-containing protein, partial [Saprospiraceae bacterium]|nr:Ig-like domain-containing protein [Saprospiraceae bacterium]